MTAVDLLAKYQGHSWLSTAATVAGISLLPENEEDEGEEGEEEEGPGDLRPPGRGRKGRRGDGSWGGMWMLRKAGGGELVEVGAGPVGLVVIAVGEATEVAGAAGHGLDRDLVPRGEVADAGRGLVAQEALGHEKVGGEAVGVAPDWRAFLQPLFHLRGGGPGVDASGRLALTLRDPSLSLRGQSASCRRRENAGRWVIGRYLCIRGGTRIRGNTD